jgi:hypothetical protein
MNEATVKITGIKREELIGSDFFGIFTHLMAVRYMGGICKVCNRLSAYSCDKAGKLTDVFFNGSVYKNDVGKVLGVVMVARCNKAKASGFVYRSLLEASLDPLVTINAEGTDY